MFLGHRNYTKSIVGISLSVGLVAIFIYYTTEANNSLYGVKQFSPFGGWKIASNALYIYEHVPEKEIKPVPDKFKELDSIVSHYYNSHHDKISLDNPDASWGSYYMFIYPSPLIVYRNKHFGLDPVFGIMNVNTLAKLGPLYNEYGSYIIKQYPLMFCKYFLWPNVKTCFLIPKSMWITGIHLLLVMIHWEAWLKNGLG